MKKTDMYYLDGENYNNAMRYMVDNGYNTGIYLDERINDNEALVLSIDHIDKEVKIVPAEIYGKNSPMRNDEKYNRIIDACRTYNDFMKDVEDVEK